MRTVDIVSNKKNKNKNITEPKKEMPTNPVKSYIIQIQTATTFNVNVIFIIYKLND